MADMSEVVDAIRDLSSKFEDSSFFSSPHSVYDLLEKVIEILQENQERLSNIEDLIKDSNDYLKDISSNTDS